LYFTYITETSKFNYFKALPWHMRDEKPGTLTPRPHTPGRFGGEQFSSQTWEPNDTSRL